MKFSIDVGDKEKTRIDFVRGFCLGKMEIRANGELVGSNDLTDLSTHFNFQFVRRYPFEVGDKERHRLVIEHERPAFCGGMRKNWYRVIVDGKLVQEYHGY